MDDTPDPMAQFFSDHNSVDLYQVLGLTSSANVDEIKKAYRRLALQYHPDKHQSSNEAHKAATSLKFQQVGFAYTILSDATRRARYDETGRTDESFLQGVADSEGGWEGYFEAIFEELSRQRLDEDKVQYQGSDDEKADITAAYLESEGSIEHLLSHVPHTTYQDEKRLTNIINSLIKSGTVPSFPEWENSLKDSKARAARQKRGAREAVEAEKAARELGVWDEFYGSGKPGERKKKKAKAKGSDDVAAAEEDGDDESGLQALILKRAGKRKADASTFLDSLAAKYGAGDDEREANSNKKGKGKGKKRASAEVDEEDLLASPKKKSRPTRNVPPKIDDTEFAAIQAKLFGAKSSTTGAKTSTASSGGSRTRKGKRSS